MPFRKHATTAFIAVVSFALGGVTATLTNTRCNQLHATPAIMATPVAEADPTYRAIIVDAKGDEYVIDTGMSMEDCMERTKDAQVWECQDETQFDLFGNPRGGVRKDG